MTRIDPNQTPAAHGPSDRPGLGGRGGDLAAGGRPTFAEILARGKDAGAANSGTSPSPGHQAAGSIASVGSSGSERPGGFAGPELGSNAGHQAGSEAGPQAGPEPASSSTPHSASSSNPTDDSASDGSVAAAEAAAEAVAQSQNTNTNPHPATRAGGDAVRKDPADLRALLPKLVETFRIGQNRAGNAEVRMDLKATTAGGMGIRMSQGPNGVQALLLVDQYATKAALEGQIAELTQRLEAQGVRVQEVRVEIESETEGRPPQGQSDKRGSGEPSDQGDAYDDSYSALPGSRGASGLPGDRGDSRGRSPLGGQPQDPAASSGTGIHQRTGSPSRRSRTDYSL